MKTILDFMLAQPENISELLYATHDYLTERLPQGGTSSIKWSIPFYKGRGMLCYINPHKDHITIGFWEGYRLIDEKNVLLGANEKLKQIRYMEFYEISDLYGSEFNEILNQALVLDSQKKEHKSLRI